MAKNPRIGNVIVSEYVTYGEGGKAVLVNVYPGDILVSQFPAVLPLGLYVEYFSEAKKPMQGHLDLWQDNAKFGSFDIEIPTTDPGDPAVIALRQFSVTFDGPGILEIKLSISNYRTVSLIKKGIRMGGEQAPSSISVEQPLPRTQRAPRA